tara:strand:+ start:8890 stop:9402 length:513 start_codon:yes stop_codon:yes gene_type:complete
MSFDSIIQEHVEEVSDFERDLKLLRGDNPRVALNYRPSISYDLLLFKEDLKHCFTSDSFSRSDFHIYIDIIKKVCNFRMEELMDGKRGSTGIDFEIYDNPNQRLKDFFWLATKNTSPNNQDLPALGRIGLYNSEDGNGKAPRIFFALGYNSTLHLILCDPEHLVYPRPNK